MKNGDRFGTEDLKHLRMFIYLVPIVGFFPALWTLYRKRGNQEQREVSRLAITLALGWLFGYVLLGTGAQAIDSLSLPLLITSSLLTSGYFLVNIWLMVRLWQRQPIQFHGLNSYGFIRKSVNSSRKRL
jgi:hypothetical protein